MKYQILDEGPAPDSGINQFITHQRGLDEFKGEWMIVVSWENVSPYIRYSDVQVSMLKFTYWYQEPINKRRSGWLRGSRFVSGYDRISIYAESLKWLNPYMCYTQYRAAVCKHLVTSKQGSAVSPAITRRDPRVYVEVSRSFSYLWAPAGIYTSLYNYVLVIV